MSVTVDPPVYQGISELISRPSSPLDCCALQDEYVELVCDLESDPASRRVADSYLESRIVCSSGKPLDWALVPKVFSHSDLGYLRWIAQTTYRIMEKCVRAYRSDSRVRDFFGFDPVTERLCALRAPYECAIPIARVDIFLNEKTGDFQFCEFNTDGSAGMLTSTEALAANMRTASGRAFRAAHDVSAMDVMPRCARSILSCYRSAGGSVDRPRVAVVDYSESITMPEVRAFEPIFHELGAELVFEDIRNLTYESGVLRGVDGTRIDCVWRRVVASEMLCKPCAGAEALVCALEEGIVPIVGSMQTWPAATKTMFALLRDPLASTFLDGDEVSVVRAHIPETYMLGEGSDLSAFARRESWILKPRDGYNGVGVVAGSECGEAEWERALREVASSRGTIQRYAPQFQTLNCSGRSDLNETLSPHSNMEGLYLFGGEFGGVFTRCGRSAVIAADTGRLHTACLITS